MIASHALIATHALFIPHALIAAHALIALPFQYRSHELQPKAIHTFYMKPIVHSVAPSKVALATSSCTPHAMIAGTSVALADFPNCCAREIRMPLLPSGLFNLLETSSHPCVLPCTRNANELMHWLLRTTTQ